MHKLIKISFFLLPLTTFSAFSEEAASEEVAVEEVIVEESTTSLSVELGILVQTGNVRSADFKAGFNVSHEDGQWLNLFKMDVLGKKLETTDEVTDEKSYDTTDNKFSANYQGNYTLSPEGKNYLYGNLSYAEDRFSSFDKQSSVSVGWGKHWYESDTASFFADIGPGYKHDVLTATDTMPSEDQNAFIIQAQALYLNSFNEHVEFKQLFVAKYAPDTVQNSIYKSETSLTTKLMESLQFKFTFTVDYNTEVEEDFENLDTQTSVTLVYNF